MPRIVSSIKKHITTTEFWRALSFVLKRLESIAKYLTKLPLPFTFSLYILHLLRAALRIYSYFYKIKNKNLGDTCKLLFAVFKVSIAIIALVLLGCGFASLPSILLASFFAYSILKLIHSAIVLLASTIAYLKIDKQSIGQRWRRAHYRDNMTKHVGMLGAGLLFVLFTCLFNVGTSILIWSNPLLLLADTVIGVGLLVAVFYLGYKIGKNKHLASENLVFMSDQAAKIKKFLLLFGLAIVALLLTAATPSLGVSAITIALVLLCSQDIVLTVYYYFNGVYIPDPEPANLNEEPLNTYIGQTNRDYYHTFSPILYLQTQVSEKLQQIKEVNKANKKLILKVTLVKLLQLENKLAKITKLSAFSRFFSSQKKLNVKKEYLLRELTWALNTDDQEVLIDLFILAIIDLAENKRTVFLKNNLCELLDLLDRGNLDYHLLQKNSLAQLFFLARQGECTQQTEIVKPQAFYQSFWKKVGACDALSQAFRASRNIEEQISVSNLPLVAYLN
ncbi:hypothetical protein A1D18_00775 [Candidatus Rickettsiella isopodorum]|jgi:hypothetical protein|uniref:Uncharacterized protein n=1 Tax=Candidatus Rickettsiella isopodorum TaxID=1225476 RepID=A0A1J8NML3_9COXI|nr:hypothetical protein [Candidatus Rickettsiella isopodorum]OIZ96130.1 hypothetical protein A1D18_00775 [Candidatus Rickettsiella isopodorum]